MQTFLTRYVLQAVLIFTLLNFGCRNSIRRSTGVASAPPNFQEHEVVPPMVLPFDSTDQLYDGLRREKSVLKFYTSRNHKPAWCNNKRLSILGDSMALFIERIRYYGALPEHYHWNEIKINRQLDDPSSLMRNDVLLTDAFLSIARDLKYGRLSELAKLIMHDSVQTSLLRQVLNGCELRPTLETQEPTFAGYCGLKQALKLSLDTLDGHVRKAFLEGRPNDSLSLNNKLKLIEINLERWRWENAIFGDRYIFINIPSFRLELISNNASIFDSKVIVGTPDKQTPLLSSLIECFIIYPYWHVPRKIAVDEYLPVIKKSSSFITKNRFDVLDQKGNILNPDSVEWEMFSKSYFPVLLRQREGTENSLGVLKFVFDNPYAVFLHDTNAKRLFSKEARAFSHGCIRMEKAVELAHYLVTGQLNQKSKIIEVYLEQHQRHTVNLIKPIPIHVRYFTCEYKGGVLFQHKDFYKRDQELIYSFYQ